MNQLYQLKKYTKVVADSSDFESIEKYTPLDTTTNPSLILKASKMEKYNYIIEKSFSSYIENTLDNLLVEFGVEILKKIPGRVSIEIDARDSFDTEKTVEKSKKIIGMFEKRGISKDRILIKLAATYEGIMACNILEKIGIHCNMTLIFSIYQAILCAESKATLISPFVGRILDWHKQNKEKQDFLPSEDPGVISVTNIYNYYKKFGYKTQIMGASFRSVEQVLALAGCDLLTISPNLLEKLENRQEVIKPFLLEENAKQIEIKKIELDEKSFRYLLNDDPMASFKLSEGVRKFSYDMQELENLLKKKDLLTI